MSLGELEVTGEAGMTLGRPEGERWVRRLWRMKRPERVAAVNKIEGKRKPEDFIGYRNGTRYAFLLRRSKN